MQFHSSDPFFIARHSPVKPVLTILAHDWEPKCWRPFCITVSQNSATAPEHFSMYCGPEAPERLRLFCCHIYFLSFCLFLLCFDISTMQHSGSLINSLLLYELSSWTPLKWLSTWGIQQLSCVCHSVSKIRPSLLFWSYLWLLSHIVYL